MQTVLLIFVKGILRLAIAAITSIQEVIVTKTEIRQRLINTIR